MMEASAQSWRLASVSGPTSVILRLEPPGPIMIGRRATHHLELADRMVSRDHARLAYRPVGTDAGATAGEWTLTDLGSKHGTRVNGRALAPDEPIPLRPGDLITIAPWVLRVEDALGASRTTSTSVATEDSPVTEATILPLQTRGLESLAQQRLALLLRCAESLQTVDGEAALARVVLDAAMAGTGFANAAILHPIEPDGRVSVVEYRGPGFGGSKGPSISRSLVREACRGQPVRLSRVAADVPTTHSIVELAIEEALCVPILLESAVELLLYLDDRAGGRSPARQSPDSAEFAAGLARLAGLALANLRRLDVERRQAHVEAELRAAAEVQRWVMPRREIRAGPFRCLGESRPGQYLGGDFFDAVPLDDGRLAVALGDVSGKGVAASVIVTVSQGFLHAALRRSGDPVQAVQELNQYLCPRCPQGKFLTLWVGVFDRESHTLTFVDAGHGYALLARPGSEVQVLREDCGDLVGIRLDGVFEARRMVLPPRGRVLILSDGFIEQTAQEPDEHESDAPVRGAPRGGGCFGLAGVQAGLADPAAAADPIATLFEAVLRHAGSAHLADDATALVVEWETPGES
ncbi:MAG: SpoIIE family protein phosphatase [Phycisphaerae bacterium]|jgi:serine phosphatase RsbU (regulator of sigma subunit)